MKYLTLLLAGTAIVNANFLAPTQIISEPVSNDNIEGMPSLDSHEEFKTHNDQRMGPANDENNYQHPMDFEGQSRFPQHHGPQNGHHRGPHGPHSDLHGPTFDNANNEEEFTDSEFWGPRSENSHQHGGHHDGPHGRFHGAPDIPRDNNFHNQNNDNDLTDSEFWNDEHRGPHGHSQQDNGPQDLHFRRNQQDSFPQDPNSQHHNAPPQFGPHDGSHNGFHGRPQGGPQSENLEHSGDSHKNGPWGGPRRGQHGGFRNGPREGPHSQHNSGWQRQSSHQRGSNGGHQNEFNHRPQDDFRGDHQGRFEKGNDDSTYGYPGSH